MPAGSGWHFSVLPKARSQYVTPGQLVGAREIQVFQEQISLSPVSPTGPAPYWSVSLYLTLGCQILKSFWLPKCGYSGEVGVD